MRARKVPAPATMPTRPGSIAGPTAAAREAGRYAKRHVKFAGFEISIENEAGTARPHGGDRHSPHAQNLVPYAYGFFDGTKGADGDEVDVFLGGDESSARAWVISARKPSGSFDEHKVMLGFHSKDEAIAAFRLAYHDASSDRMGAVREVGLPGLRAWLGERRTKSLVVRDRLVLVEFNARIEKQVRQSPTGEPVLRMLVSGTKLDSTRYEYEGVDVVGEKITPELLATMAIEAQAGGVYLIESHSGTLPLGFSCGAEIVDVDGGDQVLYVDFQLDPENPNVPYLLKKYESGEYVPQCSVGLLVRRVVAWDEDENGYVGFLMEGHFEHVALTRPDHAAFPDAQLEQVYLTGTSFDEAWKSLVASTARELDEVEAEARRATDELVDVAKGALDEEVLRTAALIVQAQRDPANVQTLVFEKAKFDATVARAWAAVHDFAFEKVDETKDALRLRQQEPGLFNPNSFRSIRLTDGVQAVIGRKKSVEASASVDTSAEGREGDDSMLKIRKTDPAAATAVTKEADDDATRKAKDDEAAKAKAKEGEDVKEDAKGDPPADGDAPPAKKGDEPVDGDAAPAKKARGATLKDLAQHLHDMHNMVKEAGESSPGDLQELLEDMSADLEMACEIADEMAGGGGGSDDAPAKEDSKEAGDAKGEDVKEDAKTKEAEDCKVKEASAATPLVVKSTDRALRQMARSINKTLSNFEARQKAVEEQLGILAKEPATSGAPRYADGSLAGKTGADATDSNEVVSQVLEIVKDLKDPRERELISRKVAERFVSQHWEGALARPAK